MNNEDFVKALKKASLNKKEFSELTGLAYSTVANWSSSQNIPIWVKSWLENYTKAKDMDKIIKAVKPYAKDVE